MALVFPADLLMAGRGALVVALSTCKSHSCGRLQVVGSTAAGQASEARGSRRRLSALAIVTSSTSSVITTTPARSTLAESGSTKDAHETVLTALEQICHDSGLTTLCHNIPAVEKGNGKTVCGDLVIKDANLIGICLLIPSSRVISTAIISRT